MNDTNVCGTTSAVAPNSYELAVKRLVQILKSKTSDNLKQLEDLWDSVNYAKSVKSLGSDLRNSPSPNSNSLSPITTMSENSNDSTSSSINGSSSNVTILLFVFRKSFKKFS